MYKHTYPYVYMYIYNAYLYVYVYIYTYMFIYTYVYMCMYVYIHTQIYTCIYALYIYIFTHSHVHMYIYVHMLVYTNTFIYRFMHMCADVRRAWACSARGLRVRGCGTPLFVPRVSAGDALQHAMGHIKKRRNTHRSALGSPSVLSWRPPPPRCCGLPPPFPPTAITVVCVPVFAKERAGLGFASHCGTAIACARRGTPGVTKAAGACASLPLAESACMHAAFATKARAHKGPAICMFCNENGRGSPLPPNLSLWRTFGTVVVENQCH